MSRGFNPFDAVGGLIGGGANLLGGVAKGAIDVGGGLVGGAGEFISDRPLLATGLLAGGIGSLAGGDFLQEMEAGIQGAQRQQLLRSKSLSEKQEVATRQENLLSSVFNKNTENFSKSFTAYDKVESALTRGTAAGDLAGIFAFMKTIDPPSVVRESEFKSAADAKGWLGKMDAEKRPVPNVVRTSIQKLVTGEKLLPEQRKDFVETARGLVESEKKGLDREVSRLRPIIKNRSLNETNVFGDLGNFEFSDIDSLNFGKAPERPGPPSPNRGPRPGQRVLKART